MKYSSEKPISSRQLSHIIGKFTELVSERSLAEGHELMSRSVMDELSRVIDQLSLYVGDIVPSEALYPTAYNGLLPLEEQIQLLAHHFELDPEPAFEACKKILPEVQVPTWTEAWAALPIYETFDETYITLLEEALIWHSGVCGNEPGCYSNVSPHGGVSMYDHFRPIGADHTFNVINRRREYFLRDWQERFGGQIMLLPVQMGFNRRGHSDRMVKAFCENHKRTELPLNSFEVACLLAMHPTRLSGSEKLTLNVNAPGDVIIPDSKLHFYNVEGRQMGSFFHTISGKKLPTFKIGSDIVREHKNAPVTGSVWSIRDLG